MSDCEISIVIPVFNEEPIVRAAVVDLRERLRPLGWSYEILLAENGSTDGTVAAATQLSERYGEVSYFSCGEPNYGQALRMGIERAKGELVICDEIDLCDADFHQRAVTMLREQPVDMVIGSKLIAGAQDERPWMRHAASHFYNRLLRYSLGFRGTDTHGLKAFRKRALAPIVANCVVDKDVFASELVIRAYRADLQIREIPVRLVEKRPPSIILLRRVPNVFKNLGKLAVAIHFRGG